MKRNLGKVVLAGVIYLSLAVYLYQPFFETFDKVDYLLVVNVCAAALGCFVLSRRWVASVAGAFFAGAVYGFGPFLLGLARFHPAAGFLAAAVPWMFCPAVFCPVGKRRLLCWPLSALPFVGIILFFLAANYFRLFPVPVHLKFRLADLPSLIMPLVMADRTAGLFGFYHVPLAALVVGTGMLLSGRRYGIMAVFAVGLVLSFCDSFWQVSSVMWLTIPLLCCSVLIGEGIGGLASAGAADRKWVLAAAVVMLVLSIVTLLLATKYFQVFAGLGTKYAKVLVYTAKIYVLGAVAMGVIFFFAKGKLRVRTIRLCIVCLAVGIDIFWGTRYIVDKVF